MNNEKILFVHSDLQYFDNPVLVGKLHCNFVRGSEILSFEYEKSWLQSDYSFQIDPDLPLFSGIQYLKQGKSNFGIFSDSSPDRWGRVLMDKREAMFARQEKRKENKLYETDYLLGVSDELRMGALRFKTEGNNDFLDNNKELSTPPWTSIRELEFASFQLENEMLNDNEKAKWLKMLYSPGSSLGGARPKAGIKDNDGNLWLAKFPSRNDSVNVGAWEMICNEMAKDCGINVVEAQAKIFSGKHHSFLSKRFDRTDKGKRLFFASSMTLLGYSDGANATKGVSYLEIVDFIIKNGANVKNDLTELFRRIVFSICVSNSDDHLRNHGFLLNGNGWNLSPAYDINPIPHSNGLCLNISFTDNSIDLNLTREVSEYFRLSHDEAEKIIENTLAITSNRNSYASKYKISREENEKMSSAFINNNV
jgi:serine/threonine-protein kinase HipA